MRVSKAGLVVAAAYVVSSIACVAWGYSLDSPKDGTVAMQLPVLPALIIFEALGLMRWLAEAPLVVAYGLLIAIVAVGLYAACWLSGALGFRTKLVMGVGAAAVLSFLLFWPIRS